MSSAMTWTARLPTLAEREHFWRDSRWVYSLFTASASWFAGVALTREFRPARTTPAEPTGCEGCVANSCRIVEGLDYEH